MLKVDVRVVSATHADLSSASGATAFRQDLYYRLAAFPVALPPLRERAGDVLLLARHFLSDICQKDGVAPKVLSAEACGVICEYAWPGNVRELQHAIERAFILAEDESVLTLGHFPTLDPQTILNLA
jgi:transcriptional regulator with GAF, ATPase, and Fis domain